MWPTTLAQHQEDEVSELCACGHLGSHTETVSKAREKNRFPKYLYFLIISKKTSIVKDWKNIFELYVPISDAN